MRPPPTRGRSPPRRCFAAHGAPHLVVGGFLGGSGGTARRCGAHNEMRRSGRQAVAGARDPRPPQPRAARVSSTNTTTAPTSLRFASGRLAITANNSSGGRSSAAAVLMRPELLFAGQATNDASRSCWVTSSITRACGSRAPTVAHTAPHHAPTPVAVGPHRAVYEIVFAPRGPTGCAVVEAATGHRAAPARPRTLVDPFGCGPAQQRARVLADEGEAGGHDYRPPRSPREVTDLVEQIGRHEARTSGAEIADVGTRRVLAISGAKRTESSQILTDAARG